MSRFLPIAVLICLISAPPLYTQAAVPALVKDINAVPTGTVVKDSFPTYILTVGSRAYFAAQTGTIGNELYLTDGTSNGTTLLKDIRAGSGSSSPKDLTAIDATRFVFSADDGINGRELWISDGTTNGTVMLKDINSNAAAASNPSYLTNIGGGIVLFWATDGTAVDAHGQEIWRTDGTAAGTYRLSDIAAGSTSSIPQVPGFVAFAGKAFFAAQDLALNSELYSTDGTNTNTTQLFKEINADPSKGSAPRNFAVRTSTQMFFNASDGAHGEELWVTDGTPSGTVMMKDILAGPGASAPAGLKLYNNKIYFSAFASASSGRELFVTDGTTNGTALLSELWPGKFSSNPRYFAVANGKLFFNAGDPLHGKELWVSDGTPAGTISMDSMPGTVGTNPWNLVAITFTGIGERLLFQGTYGTSGIDSKIWISDGTTSGTAILANVSQGNTGFITVPYAPFAGGALFSGLETTALGRELYKTDGTSNGTVLVADIAVPSGTADARPAQLTAVGSTLFFQATDGINGVGLWKSDGTTNGTVLVADTDPSTNNINALPQALVNAGGTLFYQGTDGSTNGGHGAELWKSDGTTLGTVMVKDIRAGTNGSSPSSLIYNGSVVLFAANDGTGSKLWTSDGTSNNTQVALDANTNSISSFSNPFRDGTDIYMAAAVSTNSVGTELYRYRAGTFSIVADINTTTATAGSFPSAMVKLGNLLIYRASDGVNGSELWGTNVLTDASTMIADTFPGGANSNGNAQIFAVAGSKVFFTATDGPTSGFELWASDGTTAGTYMVKDVRPGTSGGLVSAAGTTAIGNKVVFAANDGTNGLEPWVSDGTSNGTFMLKDIAPASAVAPFGSSISTAAFINANGTIYFQANDGINVHGAELWKTDGTTAGTVLVGEINIGSGTAGYSNPVSFTLIGNTMFFAATDGAAYHGLELFKLDVTP